MKENVSGVEMLHSLVNTQGQRIGPLVVDRLLSDDISRLIIMGQPGAGKTTLLYQVDYSLNDFMKISGMPIERSIVLYDSWMRSAKRRGEKPDTPEFNYSLAQKISQLTNRTKANAEGKDYSKRIVLAEIPAVGYIQPKDRGVSAVEQLAKETDDTLFLYVVAHPLSQIRGLAARFTAAITPEKDVISVLAKRHNIIIDAEGIDDKKVLGRKIKIAVRWTAKGPHVRAILYEMGHQFALWRHLDRKDAKAEVEEVILPESYNPHKVSELLTREPIDFLDPEDAFFNLLVRRKALSRSYLPRIEAAYAGYRFRKLGVPEDRYMVAFNPYTTKPIHLHITA